MRKGRLNRRGYILVAVLACMSLVLALTLAALQTALRMRREVTMQHLVSQTSLLCETGIARATYRQQDPDYLGESWRPLLTELPGKQAEVTIVFLERSPTRTKVQVTAVLEDAQKRNGNRVQRSLTTNLVHESQTESSKGENL